MGRYSLVAASLVLAVSAGCHHRGPSHVAGGVLGRVVIYRNGVAFYERNATVEDGKLQVKVPRDRVDDFLKSLTVVDERSGKALAVTIPRKQDDSGSHLTMTLAIPEAREAQVKLTYVTESPAWKPSYRVVVGADGKRVMLEAWAIVDNTTSEDWKGVLVGVGASSALAFRYDLWSVKSVDRDLLQGEQRFAVAPPTGVSPYAEGSGEELVALSGSEVRTAPLVPIEPAIASRTPGKEVIAVSGTAPVIDQGSTKTGVTIEYNKNIPVPGRTFDSVLGTAAGSQTDGVSFSGSTSLENQYYVEGVNTTGLTDGRKSKAPPPPPPPPQIDDKLKPILAKILKSKHDVLIQVHGTEQAGGERSAIARGNTVRNRLVDQGVAASRIHVVAKVGPNEPDTVRVVSVTPKQVERVAASANPSDASEVAVGESHFISERPMTVAAGSSAMVSMMRTETSGGVVYLFDPISERGNAAFAFKAIHLDNPTDDTLEAGPITVYGAGRFIGEGITEPISPRAPVVVPFALDKQVIVSRHGTEQDKIARLVTAQRGVITAELQHRRDTKFTVTSRLNAPTKVFLRHRLEQGWSLVESPPKFTKVNDSHLFEIELGAKETKYVTISEATPIERSFKLASDEGLGLMKVFINEPNASPALKAQIEGMLGTYQGAADLMDRIETLREQLGEYRGRGAELNAQLVTLRAVRTGGALVTSLKAKLADIAERTQQATIAVVETQEKLMLAKVKFANQLAELKLIDVTARK